ILANDISAPDMGETLRVTDTSTPAHGTLTITNNGTTVRFEPVPGYSGPDAFTYTISDGNGGSDTASVAITVVMGNNAVPVAVADAVSINEDAAPTSIAVLANDTGLTDLPLTVALVSQPASGTAEVQSDNTILYTAPPGYSGVVSFTYSVADVDLQSSSAEVTITISAVDDVPVATADSVTLPEDTAVNVAVLANDPNLGDAPTTLTIQTEPIHGTAVIETDNSITYTPEPNYFGTDTFAYRIADSTQSAQAIVTLIVTAVADAPEAVADVASGRAGQELDIDVMANDISVDGDELTLTITTPPANGTATVESGVVHYAPNPGYTGSDTFLYSVTNTSGLSDEASVVVGVGTDADGDGIIDVDEVALGTDPAVGDTDGDGVLDGQEVNVTGTDPLDDDSDDDGLTDFNEDPDHDGLIGDGETDPNVFDTDDDGLSDGLEVGLTEPQGDDTDPAEFAADQDPATTTDP
ncbi:MAG: tandem-95 repeat protein, partial [Microbacteriaceae bacterium]|nr:tandem-95 repeat protein [Microbacteriaceae bacterium]